MRTLVRLAAAVVLAVLATSIPAPPTAAQSVLEQLVSPGPLSAAHVREESRCASCHQAFNRQSQSRLCLDCHRPIAADVAARTGFHGRAAAVAGAECRTCHTEHRGRAARIVNLNTARFDHNVTDFALRGGHLGVACASCHAPGGKYRAAPATCAACHRADDAHRGALGANCAQCHVETAWRTVRFNHATTRFPLAGAHAAAACASCHADKRFRGTSTACATCHAAKDVHRGAMGPACGSCHGTTAWTPARFDHAGTGFPLVGAHVRVTCAACHPGGRYQQARPACASCHAADDPHRGRYGASCADCHTSRDWRVARFDHGRTGFALAGAHSALTCRQCHGPSPARETAPTTTCFGCHATDDKHRGANGTACEQCHGMTSWTAVTFNHDTTRFALRGAHGRVACAQCHIRPANEAKPEMACASCHAARDAHAGQLGQDCGACHGVDGWKLGVRFDHATTQFPLIGRHIGLACAACHASPRFEDAATTCAECHHENDPHRGAYPGDCASCHTAAGWAAWAFDHSTTSFPLSGGHAGVECVSCHTPGRRLEVRNCATCHSDDDPHRGAFGPDCRQCHSTSSFEFRGAAN